VSLNEEILIEKIGVLNDVLSSESKRELIAAVNTLGEPDREIIIRRYYYQQKPKDIGYILDVPVKQIENCLYRSKLKLREIILSESGR
jgi:RNA polymerase sigma-70 factor (ECF subfamily)